MDRLVQQSILQVLEPVCESKFHRYSYGFRPNRSCKQAVAMCYKLAQVNGYHYVVDVDIKGFFDHVNHGKLLKTALESGNTRQKSAVRHKQNVESTCRGKRKENYSAGGYASRRCSQPIACEHRTQ